MEHGPPARDHTLKKTDSPPQHPSTEHSSTTRVGCVISLFHSKSLSGLIEAGLKLVTSAATSIQIKKNEYIVPILFLSVPDLSLTHDFPTVLQNF